MVTNLLNDAQCAIVKRFLACALFLACILTGNAQSLTDGLMMPRKTLCTGLMYTHDQWTNYWEGDLKRDNGNIGRLTTQSLMYFANYGLIDHLDVLVMLPYVKTNASQGTLAGQEGIQDLSVGLKYNFFRKKTENTSFSAFGIVNFSTPLSDYTPDFLPLSIGMQTTNVTYRLTGYFRINQGWFFNTSAGYTWRSNTTLDRTSYYDGNELVISNEVKMPNVFDIFVSTGYHVGAFQAELNYIQQNTLGGADIRRQDMPFVSNRMNSQRLGVLVMYYPKMVRNLALRGSVHQTVAGRNVGQSTTFLGGVLYTFHFQKEQ